MAEQLDKIFHEGLEAWKEQIEEIKNKTPQRRIEKNRETKGI